MEIAKLFVNLGIKIINTILDIGFSGAYKGIAESGWKTSQNIANMFFILIMIFIAFATILRIERYGVKKILPKILVIALLINFSLPLTYLMIDVSNITARTFTSQLTDVDEDLGSKLVDGIKANLMLVENGCNYDDNKICNPPGGPTKSRGELEACWERVTELEEECRQKNAATLEAQQTQKDSQSAWEIIAIAFVSSAFMMLAALVLIAAGLMLIIRLVSLTMLVILAPLAFICYATPSLEKYAREWWSNLLKWCFFAPVFTFFFLLAVQNIENLKNSLATSGMIVEGGWVTAFIGNTANSAAYFVFLGLILGGMIVAQKLGITGASATMGIAKKWQKGATDWAKKKAGKVATETGQMYRGGARQLAGKTLQKFPGLKSLGATMEAKGKLDWRKPSSSKEIEQFKKELAVMTPEQRAMLMKSKTISSPRKLAIAQVAVEQKDKFAKNGEYARQVRDTFQAYGMQKDATEIERRNPRIVTDPNPAIQKQKQKERTQEGIDRGYHKDWGEEAFESVNGGDILAENITDITKDFHEFSKVFNELSAEAQKKLKDRMAAIAPTLTGAIGQKARQAYAIVSGTPDLAITNPTELKTYIEAMRPTDLENVELSSMSNIATYVGASAASGARNLSDNKKRELVAQWTHIVNVGTMPGATAAQTVEAGKALKTLDVLKKSEAWESLIP